MSTGFRCDLRLTFTITTDHQSRKQERLPCRNLSPQREGNTFDALDWHSHRTDRYWYQSKEKDERRLCLQGDFARVCSNLLNSAQRKEQNTKVLFSYIAFMPPFNLLKWF